ncbi:autotransporter outer membrane beta-barrel domain-containing protein [Undibacterium sp. Di24W]|uniref:autotransporter outer membrane beta-barrel domain-containing protein n=1 Tax=Undibacterium sp. Di24W TaxID=3413033 RepID=UPI003BF1B3FA
MITIQSKSRIPLKQVFVSLIAFAFIPSAIAGRPMIVDDAGVVANKTCQVESWRQKNLTGAEYWAVPACNLTGNLELAMGGARLVSNQMRSVNRFQMQGKTLFKTMDSNGWGAGLVFGNQFDPSQGMVGDLYIRAPVSFSFREDQVIVHTNLGWSHNKNTKSDAATWGVGTEISLNSRTALTAEIYGQTQVKPSFQLGIRHTLIPDQLQLSVSYGDRLSSRQADRFTSVGLVFSSISIF